MKTGRRIIWFVINIVIVSIVLKMRIAPLDHYGDRSPYCKEFECNYAYCKRAECLSYEDQLEER